MLYGYACWLVRPALGAGSMRLMRGLLARLGVRNGTVFVTTLVRKRRANSYT